jgi:hypothetical protein
MAQNVNLRHYRRLAAYILKLCPPDWKGKTCRDGSVAAEDEPSLFSFKAERHSALLGLACP